MMAQSPLPKRKQTAAVSKMLVAIILVVLIFAAGIVLYNYLNPNPCTSSGYHCAKVTNRSWATLGNTAISIGSTATSTLKFDVQNLSPNQTLIYSGLSAVASISPQTSTITISPNPAGVPSIAYQGTSQPVQLKVSTDNAPNGQYSIEIKIMQNGQMLANSNLTLTVQ